MFFTLAGALSGAPQASAESVYDNKLIQADDLAIVPRGSLSEEFFDLSTSWASALNHDSAVCVTQQMRDDLTNAEFMAISKGRSHADSKYMGAKFEDYINITYSTSTENKTWAFSNSENAAGLVISDSVTAMNNIEINVLADGTPIVRCNNTWTPYTVSFWVWKINEDSEYWKTPFLTWGVPITYPEDYEGEIIKDSYTPPGDHYNIGTEYTPSFSYDVDDKVLKVTDVTQKNYIETYKISKCMFQLPNNLQGDNFVEVEYDCMVQPIIEHTVEENGSHNIILRHYSEETDLWYETTRVIKMQGKHSGIANKYEDELMTNCFKEEIPYIDFDGCINTLKKIGNLLSFGMLKFGNSWHYSSGCSNFSVIDDWLMLETSYVCPKVSETVRNGVTPFVTFILGLITVRFLAKQGGDGF